MHACDRCKKPTTVSTTSMFNTQTICPDCHDAERRHPRYAEARDAENVAIAKGDYNFPGIGLPPELDPALAPKPAASAIEGPFHGFHDVRALPIKAGDHILVKEGTLVRMRTRTADVVPMHRDYQAFVEHVSYGETRTVGTVWRAPGKPDEFVWAHVSDQDLALIAARLELPYGTREERVAADARIQALACGNLREPRPEVSRPLDDGVVALDARVHVENPHVFFHYGQRGMAEVDINEVAKP